MGAHGFTNRRMVVAALGALLAGPAAAIASAKEAIAIHDRPDYDEPVFRGRRGKMRTANGASGAAAAKRAARKRRNIAKHPRGAA